MAKVTGKFQITLPKAAVTESGIAVGDTLDIRVNGGGLLVTRRTQGGVAHDTRERLTHFDRATKRQHKRATAPKGATRGWTREELYTRGRAD
ncbi:MAG: AbrB/MazE/SpoVT family DNA-binding domain-containing protein [Acidobacteriota bacterium]|nr:AbrB/MazE/SpoVT family DNA-binding domain-containing protein [Acidobacteriota bacterium]